MQMYRFARDLRLGRWSDALEHLGVGERKRRYYSDRWTRRPKAFGDAFLEVHFGWTPTIKEIYAVTNILQGGVPPVLVKGRATGKWSETVYQNYSPTFGYTQKREHTVKVQLIADVSVSDANMFLANQLGLVNPAVVAWELVPFSFVVDWFLPIGNFLGQWTNFVGLNIANPATTSYGIATIDRHEWDLPYYDRRLTKTRVLTKRTTGIANPPLMVNKWQSGVSPTRAATAISLLLQQLRG
jgi:hypothetical protein